LAVNDEIGFLQRGLVAAMSVLRRGGRLTVITFHRWKIAWLSSSAVNGRGIMQLRARVDLPEFETAISAFEMWNRKAIQPSAEVAANPRSRSAVADFRKCSISG
jgi:16S rRNA C1402 N4-methylase RsmH